VTRLWDGLRLKRFSWLDLACFLLIWIVIQTVRDAVSWPWWLADAVVIGGVLVAVCAVAFAHGVWAGLRG
jgi:hypothetical protein